MQKTWPYAKRQPGNCVPLKVVHKGSSISSLYDALLGANPPVRLSHILEMFQNALLETLCPKPYRRDGSGGGESSARLVATTTCTSCFTRACPNATGRDEEDHVSHELVLAF